MSRFAPSFRLGRHAIGAGQPTYVIAELSCNHNGDYDEAVRLLRAAKDAGCNAVKLQTYTADTISRRIKNERFRIRGSMWDGSYTFDLYDKAATPYEWHERLFAQAAALDLDMFSSPFDESAVDFLESLNAPFYKVASFEVVDHPLLVKMAQTGKPIVMSNGMTYLHELDEAIGILSGAGCKELALLHCNSGYPTRFEEAHLRTIPVLAQMYPVPIGLSDHSLWADADPKDPKGPMPHIAPTEGVRLGACIVEVHLLGDRDEARALFAKGEGGFDWPFSRTPAELKKMVDSIRAVEKDRNMSYETELERECAVRALGDVCFEPTARELGNRGTRPTLWITKTVKKGDVLMFEGGGGNAAGNFDSIRPGGGLHTRYASVFEGVRVSCDVEAGTPLSWDHVLLH